MGPGGVLDAFIEAREQGLVRFLGVTGHELAIARMHLRSLERFDFDAVLLPYNFPLMQNPSYRADFEALLRVCAARNVAVQTIKSAARGPWGDQPHTAGTWYEPFTDQAGSIRRSTGCCSRPGIFLNTPGDRAICCPKCWTRPPASPQAPAAKPRMRRWRRRRDAAVRVTSVRGKLANRSSIFAISSLSSFACGSDRR